MTNELIGDTGVNEVMEVLWFYGQYSISVHMKK
ncbi:hypothetical protein HNQ54_002610 [Anaerocolumna cellulosilytica]|nr:hypothetical protein [Anaerocolumna cellulosilytica]